MTYFLGKDKPFCNMRVNQNKSDENESIDEGGQVAEIVKGDSKGETGAPERKFNSNWIKKYAWPCLYLTIKCTVKNV